FAAHAIGCDSFATGHFPDDHVAQICRLSPDEWPMLIVELRGPSIPLQDPASGEAIWFGGTANRLSNERIDYPLIDGMHVATKLDDGFGAVASAEAMPHGS